MMSGGPVRKFNPVYLLAYIFVPILISGLCIWLAFTLFPHGGTGAAILTMGPSLLSVAWWIGGGRFLYGRAKKRMEKLLKEQGIQANQVFYSRGWSIFADVAGGKIGLVSFWNPTKIFLIPASRIEKTWTDDGIGGVGIFKGSSRVSFLLQIDNANVRVDTFLSNKRFPPDNSHVLDGISKADTWLEILEAARSKAV